MSERPDIRNLESVQATTTPGCLFLWGFAPFVAIATWWIIAGWSFSLLVTILASLPLFAALSCASSIKIRTDSRGITFWRLFRKRLVPWPDVIRAETPRNEDNLTDIVIESKSTRLRTFLEDPHDGYLQASIWQHLRRLGKHGGIRLSQVALSLWWTIPDSIPREMDWNYNVGRDGGPPPSHFELRTEHISQLITGKKKQNDCPVTRRRNPLVIRWSEVKSARWWQYSEPQWSSLIIKGPQNVTIEVPVSRKSRQSAEFALGVIRRLRELDQLGPIAIPGRLMKQIRSQ